MKSGLQSFQSMSSQIGKMSNKSLHKESSKNFHYLNQTGPGDYEQVNMTGKSLLESNRKNAPQFSFGTRAVKAPIISKKHIQELIGNDSPGVGLYNTIVLDDRSPKFSMGSEPRFGEKPSIINMKRNM